MRVDVHGEPSKTRGQYPSSPPFFAPAELRMARPIKSSKASATEDARSMGAKNVLRSHCKRKRVGEGWTFILRTLKLCTIRIFSRVLDFLMNITQDLLKISIDGCWIIIQENQLIRVSLHHGKWYFILLFVIKVVRWNLRII